MKKLKLDVAALRVESFTTRRPEGQNGTVHGASITETYGTIAWPYCGGGTYECDHTWDGTTGDCCKPSMYNNNCTM